MKTRIHDLGDVFAERNMFLQVGLGLISLCLRFERLVAAHGTPLVAPPEGALDRSSSLALDKPLAGGREHLAGIHTDAAPVLRLQMSGQSSSESAPQMDESPFLYFLLGLAAFSRQLLFHAEKASLAAARVEHRAEQQPYSLRRLLT